MSTTPELSQGITNEDQGDRNQLKMIIATFRSDAGVTRGSYSVALPDGRIQTVKYTATPVGELVLKNMRGHIGPLCMFLYCFLINIF